MGFVRKALAVVGKADMELDPSIPATYVAGQCLRYGLMLARGCLKRLGRTRGSGVLFIGRNVRVKCADRLECGPQVRLQDGCFIDALSTDGVRLRGGVLLGRNCRVECTGSLASVGKGLVVGEGSTFGSDCYFGAAGGIEIGADVMAGQYVRFHSENHCFADPIVPIRSQGVTHEGIRVGHGCWIGAGAVFLDGSSLGEGCVVAANAVVTKEFPAGSIVAGVPAKVIGNRFKDEKTANVKRP